jgi:predicted ATPase
VESEARKPAHSLFTDGANFGAWYETIANADTETLQEYLKAVKEVIPGLRAVNLKPLHRAGKLFETEIQVNGVRKAFALDELSEGQISLLVLYAVLHFCVSRGMTVALDEPDNYLALAEIEPFLYALEDAAEASHAQVFLISHHPEIHNRWARDPDRCRYFERTDDGRFAVHSIDWGEYPGLTTAEVVARGWTDG